MYISYYRVISTLEQYSSMKNPMIKSTGKPIIRHTIEIMIVKTILLGGGRNPQVPLNTAIFGSAVILCYNIACNIILVYIMLFNVIFCHIKLYYVMLQNIIEHNINPSRVLQPVQIHVGLAVILFQGIKHMVFVTIA